MPKLALKKIGITTPDMVVLSLLAERPMHGYELNLELAGRDVQDWAEISRPQVYYSLNKLKLLKMIKEKSSDLISEGPARQVFNITSKGKNELSLALDNLKWATQRPPQPFLTWVALAVDAEPHVIKKLIKERTDFLKKEIVREKLTYKTFHDQSGVKVPAGLLMIELTIKQFEIELQWIKKLEPALLSRLNAKGSSIDKHHT
jgi:DNA-binding PadR family transcriptional regulator